MNELQRQSYLSAFGIENYMPRWRLPCAPEPIVCVLPIVTPENSESIFDSPSAAAPIISSVISSITSSKADSAITVDALADLDVRQKSTTQINAASILQQLKEDAPLAVLPFALSIWRPIPGLLIIDSRNTKLALPTDLLLNNILRAFTAETCDLREEVLRWPMIENRFVSRTEADARNELQTWLAVENELRPISRVWLCGENSARYFVAAGKSIMESRWQKVAIDGLSAQMQVSGLLLPSLNELLQNPQEKARLWSVLD